MKQVWRSCVLAVMTAMVSLFGAGAAETAPAEQFVVYYPHTTFRCYSCNKIEALTKAAIEGGTLQAEEGKDGKEGKTITVDNAPVAELVKSQKLVFQSVNVDEPEYATLLTELKTKAKMPALAKVVNGKIVAAQSLDRSWKLLSGDPAAFFKYIQDESLKFVASNK